MTRLVRLASDPLAWRIVIAAALALAVLIFARLPSDIPHRTARFVAAFTSPAEAEAEIPPLPLVPPPPLPDPAQSMPIAADAARLSNAQVPIADPQPALPAPFRFVGAPDAHLRARDCLAVAAWYEAGDDPSGERAVVQVVLNRVRHPAFPNSVCAVVFQGSQRQTGCQFTFTCDGSLARIPSPPALTRARAIAEAALSGAVDARVGLATHYHADYVVPRWRDGLVKIAQQGAHLFYRWPGYWGSAAAMSRGSGSGMEDPQPALAALSEMHDPAAVPAIAVPQILFEPVPIAMPPAPQPSSHSALEMQLDPAAPPGSYALKALALCGSLAECRVAGRLGEAGNIAFVYVRMARTRSEGAYWDCARFLRSDRAQCLPGGQALDRLLTVS
ncbi:cell wall hydrolase [Novosphingobium sp. P6W]|uniref:cell wall hydrolase n=1 Tax=Novosphingobium sp. P6W TaxID=1609758 RepID=UPI0005C688B3|nr:cell wall hydrolase [Novosphingobium sp. P6W]